MITGKSKAGMMILAGLSFLVLAGASFAQMADVPMTPRSQQETVIYERGSEPGASRSGQVIRHHYLYYPNASVYFDEGRRVYFFQEGNRWVESPTLPYQMRQGLGSSVVLEMDADTPYTFHSEVSRYYSTPGRIYRESRSYRSYATDSARSPGEVRYYREHMGSDRPSSEVHHYWEEIGSDRPTGEARYYRETEEPSSSFFTAGNMGGGHMFEYYPSAFTYYDPQKGVYYYESAGQWTEAQMLPEYIDRHKGSPVTIYLNTDTPYMAHSEVVQRFPHPGYDVNVERIRRVERTRILREY